MNHRSKKMLGNGVLGSPGRKATAQAQLQSRINWKSLVGRLMDSSISLCRGNSASLPRNIESQGGLWVGLIDWALLGRGVAISGNMAPAFAVATFDPVGAVGPGVTCEKATDTE